LNKINVHNNWDPLEEIWLGDTWPAHFYDNESQEVRDSFYQITEWTKNDLNAIQKKFESFGVTVRRPHIDETKRELYTINEKSSILRKPPICPRDNHGVIGNNLFHIGDFNECYEPLYNLYDPQNVHCAWPDKPKILGSNIVKIGRDIIFDHVGALIQRRPITERKENIFLLFERFENIEKEWFGKDYRLHFSIEGGHLDSCYMPVKEKLVLTTEYFDGYDVILPNWKTIGIHSPSYTAEQVTWKHNNIVSTTDTPENKWSANFAGMMDFAPPHFTAHLKKFCKDWIGNYKETYFEVNVVPIDEKNLICIGKENAMFEKLFTELENNGITCHAVPWRTRGFWDGGIHCITLDVRRRGELKDYFPERGEYGIKSIRSDLFNNSTESFFKEYNQWKTR
jgi:hypothetical protein